MKQICIDIIHHCSSCCWSQSLRLWVQFYFSLIHFKDIFQGICPCKGAFKTIRLKSTFYPLKQAVRFQQDTTMNKKLVEIKISWVLLKITTLLKSGAKFPFIWKILDCTLCFILSWKHTAKFIPPVDILIKNMKSISERTAKVLIQFFQIQKNLSLKINSVFSEVSLGCVWLWRPKCLASVLQVKTV